MILYNLKSLDLHYYFNMAKVKYYYDTKTLSYKRIELNGIKRIKKIFYFLLLSSYTGLIMFVFFKKWLSKSVKVKNKFLAFITKKNIFLTIPSPI